ncbi:1-phosphofructokinase [Salimicrobium halophilum]|uniref:Tagatose-6-phosphate kinase n=1 Tax=Salimicrobium halophilum TaxID=86666 RepID=A0A1G8V6V6_9BACI|nr:1-phosphofructokinase [Salimicrobium halophilum]SDJ61771.1 fructose-1-phosphate kinase [Salimicrobium halophilum]
MIYTLTLNPSIDYTMHVSNFEPGGLTRATETDYYPGGKGINVSRVLSRLDIPSTALGYIGGFTGEFIRSALKTEGIEESFIETNQPTRINVKLKDDVESEINGPGPELNDLLQRRLLEQLDRLTSEDRLLLAGSIPSSLPDSFYRTIAEKCIKKNIPLAVDTSGQALKELLDYPLYLIKPNQKELEDLFGEPIDSKEKTALYARKLVEEGCEHVIVSLGGEGAVYVDKETTLFADAPKGEVINTVGAGDSMVAGFLAAKEQHLSPEEAFRKSVACGSATAFDSDLGKRKDVDDLYESIIIHQGGKE